jgi:hypothetical protein
MLKELTQTQTGSPTEEAFVQEMEKLAQYCPKDCTFHKHGMQDLCKASDVGLITFVQCLEEKPSACNCSLYFADSWFCKCAPRIYIATNLHK